MFLSILILPFLGALTSGFFGRKIGVKGSHFITCTCVLLSAVLASFAFYEVGIAGSPVYVYLCNWVELAGAESVIGLSILVAYYRLKGNISLRS